MATPEGETAPAAPPPGEVQRRVLEFWERTGVAERALPGTATGPIFRFTEGPPTANGMPHLGHAAARALKDVQLRYRRMTGHRIVTSMAGWDCHGLPVELEIEKKLGLKSKREIEAYGVDRFCEACRASVFETVAAWREMSRQLGYWLDYDRAYTTMSPTFMESVWWALKTLYDRHLLEKGFYVLPYCPRCETPLSSHEVAQGYREATDPSVTVRFRVRGAPDAPPRHLLVWTTTPWTLPSNLLIAARADLEYVAVRADDGGEHLLAASAVDRYQPGAAIVGRWSGRDLAGWEYEPLFPYAGPGPGRFRVVLDDMVTASEGTGFVHIAPSFGVDDQRVGEREGVGAFDPLDGRGHFTDRVAEFAGKSFKAADPLILRALTEGGHVVRSTTLRHTYPFCWRCDHALIYRALDSWFVRTSRVTDRLVANNRTVQWVPAHLRDGRFGNFLTEAKDWALSRNRYWGTPLPVWRCPAGHFTCVGSFAELAERSGAPLPAGFDPHRVTVDRIQLSCAECGQPATREPYTIDGWFDSGSAPFAQYHYPFEPGPFDPTQPLDYAAEGLDQTRGWFYTLLVIATTLFDRPAYRTCVSTDMVLNDDGRKMSKSRGSVVDPSALLTSQGGDAVRWVFLSTDFTEPMRLGEATIRQLAARTLQTVVHVTQFYLANARANELAPTREPPTAPGLLDRWLLSRLEGTAQEVDRALASFDPRPGALALKGFIDDLSTWYVRRSRPRFWAEEASPDRTAAHATLSYTLGVLSQLLAPYLPFTAEYITQELAGGRYDSAESSVHLAHWPRPSGRRDPALEAAMADLRAQVEVGRDLRQRAGVRARQPLPALIRFGGDAPAFESLGPEGVALLTEELNVVEYHRVAAVAAPEYPEADWAIRTGADGRPIWALRRTPTPELRREGLVRETLRRLQSTRKELGLAFTDRIDLVVAAEGELRDAIEVAQWRIAREVLAEKIVFHSLPGPDETEWRTWEIGGLKLAARVRRRATE
ncbi:MAG: isoleucine--tRNA ligase [Thermoplasmata archaeon]|nr:isoleucine--tRNA ligase [Thermoplasmata archaeon]